MGWGGEEGNDAMLRSLHSLHHVGKVLYYTKHFSVRSGETNLLCLFTKLSLKRCDSQPGAGGDFNHGAAQGETFVVTTTLTASSQMNTKCKTVKSKMFSFCKKKVG